MELSIKCSGCKKEYFIIVCREKENINNEKYILANKTLFNTNFGIVSNCPYCKSENVYIPNEIEKSWYILCNTRVISSTSKENTDRANEILYRIRNCANYLYKESDIKELLNELNEIKIFDVESLNNNTRFFSREIVKNAIELIICS